MFNFVLLVFFLVYLCYFGTELSFAIIIDLFIEEQPCIRDWWTSGNISTPGYSKGAHTLLVFYPVLHSSIFCNISNRFSFMFFSFPIMEKTVMFKDLSYKCGTFGALCRWKNKSIYVASWLLSHHWQMLN